MGAHLKKKRLDLLLLQKEVASKIGVDEATIYNWENNRSSPQLHYIPRIIKFLSYAPLNTQAKTFGEKIVNYRRFSGITQKELAHRLEIDPTTLARWERNKSRPFQRHLERLIAILGSKL